MGFITPVDCSCSWDDMRNYSYFVEVKMKKLILILLFITNNCLASNWECINRGLLGCNTWRMPVIHGWIVEGDHDESTLAMAFVPDEKHEWRLIK